MYWSAFSRESKSIECEYAEKKIYCEELAPVIMEAGESKSCRVGQHARDQRRTSAAVQVWRSSGQNSSKELIVRFES